MSFECPVCHKMVKGIAHLYRAHGAEGRPPKRHKYNAKATVAGGVRFASKREAERYLELMAWYDLGWITKPRLQPRFRLDVNGCKICVYIADFLYYDFRSRRLVVEDAKGVQTAAFRLKRRLFEAVYRGRLTITLV